MEGAMNRFQKIYILIFVLIIVMGSVTIFRSTPGIREYEFRESNPKPNLLSEDFYKNFNANKLETSLKDYLLRDKSVFFNAFLDKYIFRRPFVNNVYAAGPNFFDFSDDESYNLKNPKEMIDKNVARLKMINDELQSKGVKFLVIPVPKISSVYKYPSYVLNPEDVDGPLANYIQSSLKENGIDSFNMRDVLTLDDYYMTDHHITKSGGDKIINIIDDYLKTMNKSLLADNTTYSTMEFKGSRSRRMAYLTDMDILHIPIYNTDFKRTGDFAHQVINNMEENGTYGGYMVGDRAFTCIETNQEGADVIIYGDSFTNIVESFIWPRLKRMRSYDFRNEDVKNYERYTDTDLIVLIADENSFRLEKEYIFYK